MVAHKGPMDELRVNPMNALGTVRDFKGHIRSLKGFKKSDISVFPADPAELPEDMLRRAYGQQLPLPCQVDQMAVKYLRDILPARDTHASIRGMCGKPTLQNFRPSSDLGQALQLVKNLFSGHHDPKGEVALTMLPPRKAKTLLALEGGPMASGGSSHQTPSAPTPSALAAIEAPDAVEAPPQHEGAEEREQQEEEQAKGKPHQKDVQQMANEILQAIGEKPPAKSQAKAKTSAQKKSAPKKKPAAAAGAGPPSKKQKETLPFPGQGPGKPLHYENVTIYLCPKSCSYRVKLAGDKKDKAFSWKMDSPEAVWGRVRQHVLSLAG